MDQQGFVKLAIVAIGLVIFSFFVRGFGQLVVGRGVAENLQAPFALIGFGLVVYLFVRATLDYVGFWEIEGADR
ncbi:hypothetical protein [Halovivax sp.]|uniref:hypothetical protein n=1 Tax=Halovivax sp. TaxID=1935978 RepID=UPI0025C01724|nr:hypothetical protein [Halovivax sp.]